MYCHIQKKIIGIIPFLFFSFLIFGGLSPNSVQAANLSIKPVSGTVEVGEKIVVAITVATRAPINAISGVLQIPTSLFSVESISKSGSVLNFWITEPNFSKGAGTLSFEGVALGGFAGGTQTVVTATLRATNVGTANLNFKSGQVLANDGAGTDITDLLNGGTFSIIPAEIKTKLPEKESVVEEKEVPQPSPTLRAPEIMFGAKYGAKAILGTSEYSKSQVLLTFVAPDGAKIFILGASDVDGSFSVLVPSSLKRGTYNVTGVMIKDDKTNSEPSNLISITIGNIFSDITWEIQLLLFLLVILIIYLLLRTHVHFSNTNNTEIKKRVHDAQNVVDKSFDILREDVAEYSGRELSSAERKHLSEIKKDISDAEKVIDKKIKDIEL